MARALLHLMAVCGSVALVTAIESSDWCETGTMQPGRDCHSYSVCALDQWGYSRRLFFSCGVGTMFHPSQRVCVHSHPRICSSSKKRPTRPVPHKPEPSNAVLGFQTIGPPSPPSMVMPLRPNVFPPKPNVFPTKKPPILPTPGTQGAIVVSPSTACKAFTLAKDSVVNCTSEGQWDHHGDCQRIIKCIHTMNCELKGFIFRCPNNHYYEKASKRCVKPSRPVPCHKASDDPFGGPVAYPVIDLQEGQLAKFAAADLYWKLMDFIPQDDGKILEIEQS